MAPLGRWLKLKWRARLQLRARRIVAYLPKYGTLRLVVTRNRHGNVEVLATNDLDSDLTTIVLRKRSRWSIETLFRDVKQFSGLAACQCRVDQALVRHVAFVLITFVILQRLRLHPKETLGEVKDRLQRDLQRELITGGLPAPAPLQGKVAVAQLLTRKSCQIGLQRITTARVRGRGSGPRPSGGPTRPARRARRPGSGARPRRSRR